jgi:surface protein
MQDFSYMFLGATAFDQNIGAWNLQKATTLYAMLTSAGLSMDNFSNTLVAWAAQPDTPGLTLGANNLVYNLAGYNASVSLRSRDFIIDGASLQPMTLTLSIPSGSISTGVFLGMIGSVTVNWGNNSSNTVIGSGSTTAILKTYDSPGTYTVTVSAATPTSIYQFGDPSLVNKSTYLVSIDYGPYYLTSLAGAFNNANYRLTSVPPLPSTVTNINNIFADASSSLTLDISAWDVSGVTNMRGAFQCTAGQTAGYNPNIANWNTKNVTSMELMFANNKSFNRAIGSWNVAKVTNMSDMFVGASAFNQSINGWNTALVTLMTRMFSGATAFNQPLNNWSIAGLVSPAAMEFMLDNCAMSTPNFNDFLVNLNSYSSKSSIKLGAVGRVFNGAAAIQSYASLSSRSWTITGATSVSSLSQYSGYQFTFAYYNYLGLPAANKVYTLRDGSNAIATFNAGASVPNTTAYSFTTTLFSGGNHTLSIVDPSGVVVLSSAVVNVSIICFKEDTKILCLKYDREEYVPIQKLKKGDMVKTRLSGYVPVDMIGKTRIYNEGVKERIKDQLYVCKKSKYPELFEDLYITGAHSILVDKLTNAQKRKSLELFEQVCMTEGKYRLMACIDERTAPYEKDGECNIYHIALANDDPYSNYGVYANGLLVESCSKRFLLDLSNMVILK